MGTEARRRRVERAARVGSMGGSWPSTSLAAVLFTPSGDLAVVGTSDGTPAQIGDAEIDGRTIFYAELS